MYVKQIQKNNETFYKVVFENKEKLEQFKKVLAFYKEHVIDERHPEPDDITMDSYNLLYSGVSDINPDSEEEMSFILHKVQNILTLFFYFMQHWYIDYQLINKGDELIRAQELISELDDVMEDKLIEREAIHLKTLSSYIYAAHEDPSVLQGKKWEELKCYIEIAKEYNGRFEKK